MIISSFAPPAQETFTGYAFVDADYIAGAKGYADFRATGRSIRPGEDGCYAIVHRATTGWECGTDARGLYKMYLYQNGDVWALATSLYELAQHLRAHGIQLRPNLAVLRAFGARQAITSQLNSSHTIFQDIVLVPSFCSVTVTAEGPHVALQAPSGGVRSYDTALYEHLQTWSSRLATLGLDPRTMFTLDLSGGLDSRVVFGFALNSGILDGDSTRVQIASQERMPEDFAAATQIAQMYGLTLNGPSMPLRTMSSPEQAIANWKTHSLGVYLPVYLPSHTFDALSIRCHGAGGGTFRDIFTGTSMARRLESTRKHLEPNVFEEYSSGVLTDLEALSSMRPDVDIQKLHYREFRNRFHFGHAPQSRGFFSPLNSILVDRIADQTDATDRQIYFDLMDCLSPNLKNAPYDEPAKAPPSASPSKTAKRVGSPKPAPGAVFAESSPNGAGDNHIGPARQQRAAFAALYDLAEEALRDSDVREVIANKTVINRAQKFFREVRGKTGRPRANHPGHQDASYVLSAALAVGAPIGHDPI